jgi:hypothetical protein
MVDIRISFKCTCGHTIGDLWIKALPSEFKGQIYSSIYYIHSISLDSTLHVSAADVSDVWATMNCDTEAAELPDTDR